MILLDSSVIIAFFNEEDLFHQKALNIFKSYEKEKKNLAISDYILNECLTVILRKKNLAKSKKILDFLLNYKNMELFHLDQMGFFATIDEFNNQTDNLSFIDCSILWMARRNGFEVATFDKNIIKELKKHEIKF